MGDSIAITGVTGSLGRLFLAEQARRRPKLRVVALARDPAAAQRDPLARMLGGRIQWIQADMRHLRMSADDEARLAGVEEVWHFAAMTSLHVNADAEQIRAVNLGGTRALLALLDQLPRPPTFHYISTAYVAGCRSGLAREQELDLGQEHRNAYERSKLEAEGLVRAWFANGRRRGTIFRPSLILETDLESGLNKITSVFARLVTRAIERGEGSITLRLPPEASINLVPEDWTVETMSDLAERTSPAGECFHLTAAAPTRLSAIAEVVRSLVPGFEIRFQADAPVESLSSCSRLLDAALEDLRHYLGANLHFDRSQTLLALRERFVEPTIDFKEKTLHFLGASEQQVGSC